MTSQHIISGWEVLSSIVLILDNIHLSDTNLRDYSSICTTLLALFQFQFLECVGICNPQPPAAVCNSIEDGTGRNRHIKNLKHCPTDVKRPQMSEKVETTLCPLPDFLGFVCIFSIRSCFRPKNNYVYKNILKVNTEWSF